MASITNAKRFFQEIVLDENGNIIVLLEGKVNPVEKGVNQHNTFQKLSLTPEGYLKIYKA